MSVLLAHEGKGTLASEVTLQGVWPLWDKEPWTGHRWGQTWHQAARSGSPTSPFPTSLLPELPHASTDNIRIDSHAPLTRQTKGPAPIQTVIFCVAWLNIHMDAVLVMFMAAASDSAQAELGRCRRKRGIRALISPLLGTAPGNSGTRKAHARVHFFHPPSSFTCQTCRC